MKCIKNGSPIAGTSYMNPILPIYFLGSRHGHSFVLHFLILYLKTAREVSSFRKFGISSQIFGANEERVSLPVYTIVVLIHCNMLVFLTL